MNLKQRPKPLKINPMDPKEIKKLRLLEAIAKEGAKSQRALSQELGMSLGLVNFFLKSMAEKGFFKRKNISYNQIKYSITQEGIIEKARLTSLYMTHLLTNYRESLSIIKEMVDSLKDKNIKKIVLFGVSELSDLVFTSLQDSSYEILGIVDTENNNRVYMGFEVDKLSNLKNFKTFDALIITKLENSSTYKDFLVENGIREEKILDLMQMA
jgi:DNA-binding Lrp family transcriptional regulator